MKKSFSMISAALVAMAVLTVPAVARERDDGDDDGDDRSELPEYVNVTEVLAAGTGCPATDDGDAVLYADQFLVLNLDRMAAEAGDGADIRDGRKACQFLVELEYPEGWSYRVVAAKTIARARIDEDASASVLVSSYFQGSDVTAVAEAEYFGPERGPQEVDLALAGEWSPCDASRALNLKSEVRARAPRRGDSSARVSLEGPVAVLLEWQRCN
jgi:hypothetical protein